MSHATTMELQYRLRCRRWRPSRKRRCLRRKLLPVMVLQYCRWSSAGCRLQCLCNLLTQTGTASSFSMRVTAGFFFGTVFPADAYRGEKRVGLYDQPLHKHALPSRDASCGNGSTFGRIICVIRGGLHLRNSDPISLEHPLLCFL